MNTKTTNEQPKNSSFCFTIQALRRSALSVLELTPHATEFTIKKQYQTLALKHYQPHDEGRREEEIITMDDQFPKICAAYELLMNSDGTLRTNVDSLLRKSSFTDPHELFQQHCCSFCERNVGFINSPPKKHNKKSKDVSSLLSSPPSSPLMIMRTSVKRDSSSSTHHHHHHQDTLLFTKPKRQRQICLDDSYGQLFTA